MKVSNAYFKHPLTGEMIKPGEMYQEFDQKLLFAASISNLGLPKEKKATGRQKANSPEETTQSPEEPKEESNLESPNADNESGSHSEEPTAKTLSDMTVTELKKLAKEIQIDGYGSMNKAELVSVVETHLAKQSSAAGSDAPTVVTEP